MILKGIVSSIESNKCKVYIQEKNYLTGLIPLAKHIETVSVNETVVVAFYDNTLLDGVVIAKL